jgi:hypothetical protein
MTGAARMRSFEELYAEIQALPEGSQGEILTPGEVHITLGRPGKAHPSARGETHSRGRSPKRRRIGRQGLVARI